MNDAFEIRFTSNLKAIRFRARNDPKPGATVMAPWFYSTGELAERRP